MTEQDYFHYLGTHQGHRLDQMQRRINEQMVRDCTMLELADAITKLSASDSDALRHCYAWEKSSEFYQLILNMMINYYREQARKVAEELAI